VGLDFGSAASIVELECRIDVAICTVGVNLTSCRLAVAHDRVTKRLQGDGVGGRQQEGRKKENGKRCETEHGTRLCHRFGANARVAKLELWLFWTLAIASGQRACGRLSEGGYWID